jgi:HSP20 family protein
MSDNLPEQRSARADRSAPMQDLEQLTERMRRFLDETFGGFPWPSFPDGRAGWSPPVDIEETDDAYVVEAELPSVKREDVNVELVGNQLEITGEIREREHKGTLRRKTRRTGRFAYRVTLPSKADGDNIDASLADGVLTVRIPKVEQDERRRIEIKS